MRFEFSLYMRGKCYVTKKVAALYVERSIHSVAIRNGGAAGIDFNDFQVFGVCAFLYWYFAKLP